MAKFKVWEPRYFLQIKQTKENYISIPDYTFSFVEGALVGKTSFKSGAWPLRKDSLKSTCISFIRLKKYKLDVSNKSLFQITSVR
jgi:hypothetical protein